MKQDFPKDTEKYKLIVSDFDGTLAGSDHLISQKVRVAIKRWIDSGRHFTIASGRQYEMIGQDTAVLDLKTPIIVRGGAEIIKPDGEKIYQEVIDKKTAKEFISILTENGLKISAEIGPILYGNFPFGVESYPQITEKPLEQIPFVDVPKINVRVFPEKVKEIEALMDNVVIPKFPTLHLVRSYNPHGMAYDVTSLKGTKHLAVLELIKHLGLDRSETVGVGDGYNDFPLLEASGLKVAMGNANDELKAIADVVVPTLSDDGVAYLIDKLIENPKFE